jgi:hypothetical protein
MCRLIRLLYRLLPWARFRDILIRRHLTVCPKCGPAAAVEKDWAGAFHPPDWVRQTGTLWTGIRNRMDAPAPSAESARRLERRNRPPVRWAVAGAGMIGVAILALVLWLNRGSFVALAPETAVREGSRVTVLSAEVLGREAKSTVFQTKSASFIWFYGTPADGGQR